MNIVRIKTDASNKPDIGFTLAYECVVEYQGDIVDKYEEAMFSERQVKSTQAELLGVVYGLSQSFKRFQGEPEKYQIAIESDCEYAVDVLNKRDIESEKLRKTVYPLLNKFDCWRVNWIPRRLNKRTNNLARERLRRAEDGV